MAASDDKHNRLSTLSQDVIAVPKKAAAQGAPASVPEPPVIQRPPERREIPPAQDVFRVPTGYTQAQPALPPPVAAAPSSQPLPVPLIATGGVAVVALAVAIWALAAGGAVSTAPAGPEAARLAGELAAANERLARLEARLAAPAPAVEAPRAGSEPAVNVLQVTAGLRDLRDDLDGLSNRLDALQAQVGEVRTLAGAGSKDAKMAMAQSEQVVARLATINQQLASLPKGATGGAASGAGGDVQAQLKALTQKTDKLAADIRQLYRQVGTE